MLKVIGDVVYDKVMIMVEYFEHFCLLMQKVLKVKQIYVGFDEFDEKCIEEKTIVS